MNRTLFYCLRLTTLAFGVSMSAAYAGKINIENGEGDSIVAILDSESMHFVDAYRVKMTDDGIRFNRDGRVKLTSRTLTPTVARMDYIYTKDGLEYSRQYYARSGKPVGTVLARIGAELSTGPETSEISPGDIELDMSEKTLYRPDTLSRVRAPNLPEVEGGVIAGNGINVADAEVKIFRQIETDIATNTVPRGGKLVGYVSKAVCPSCKAASKLLAETYDINGGIYQLLEAGTDAPIDPQKIESIGSSKKLLERRKVYIKSHLSNTFVPIDHTTRITPDPVERIEAEEAREAAAEPCGV